MREPFRNVTTKNKLRILMIGLVVILGGGVGFDILTHPHRSMFPRWPPSFPCCWRLQD